MHQFHGRENIRNADRALHALRANYHLDMSPHLWGTNHTLWVAL